MVKTRKQKGLEEKIRKWKKEFKVKECRVNLSKKEIPENLSKLKELRKSHGSQADKFCADIIEKSKYVFMF